MDQKVISLIEKGQVVEHDPEELSDKVKEELIDLVQTIENQEETNSGSKAAYWFYRVPFAGVRYYSYE